MLDERISGAAARLAAEEGVRPGDRIALWAPNSIEYVIAFFAILRLGASLVPVNQRWPSESCHKIVRDAGCKLLLFDGPLPSNLDIRISPIASPEAIPGNTDNDSQINTIDPDREATLIFTSGSTGNAKGVRLTFANHYHNALGSNRNIELNEGDCWLVGLPFYHVSGLSILFRCFLAGACVQLTDDLDPASILDLLSRGIISHFSAVPPMLRRLIDELPDPGVLQALRCILLGGAPSAQSLLADCGELRLPIFTTYGMTETASQITTTKPEDGSSRWPTSGVCLPYRQIRILDEEGIPVPTGGKGEIAVRGQVVFDGYLGGAKRNPAQWFRTGDHGFLDAEGYLTLAGRKDDLILSGAEKIYPAEIERVVREYSDIQDCRILAEPDEIWGERPVLVVEPKPDGTFSLESLYAYLKTRLSKIQMPDRVAVLDRFPRTPTGKIDTERLRKQPGRIDVSWHNE